MDKDLALAQALQKQFDMEYLEQENQVKYEPSLPQAKYSQEVDPNLEIEDPVPNIYELFTYFDDKYFGGKLGSVEVKWSNRMYSCAGTCTYKGRAGCIITLSAPLLKFRPRKDLVETLLHEMIHAFLFVAYKNAEHEEHGPMFHEIMHRINRLSGANITVYHSFHDEVEHHKTHWWRCNGPCKDQRPYFGIVKRTTNRAPGPYDYWFSRHKVNCGGEFIKIKEPDGFKSRKRSDTKDKQIAGNKKTINKSIPSGLMKNYLPTKIHGINNTSATISKNKTIVPTKLSNNIHGFKGPSNSPAVSGISPKSSSSKQSKINNWIKTNGSLSRNVSSPQPATIKSKNNGNFNHGRSNEKFSNVGQALMSNRGGTLLERPKTIKNSTTEYSQTIVKETTSVLPFSGKGNQLNPNCKHEEINRANSRLLKTFSKPKPNFSVNSIETVNLVERAEGEASSRLGTTYKDSKQISNSDIVVENSEEFLMEVCDLTEDDFSFCFTEEKVESSSEPNKLNVDKAACPVCNIEYSMEIINEHIDKCLETTNLTDPW